MKSRVLFIVALVLVVLTVALRLFVKDPRQRSGLSYSEYIVNETVLPPAVHLPLIIGIVTFYVVFAGTYLYTDKLIGRPNVGRTHVRFRKGVLRMYYSLIACCLLVIIEIIGIILSWLRMEDFGFAHFVYSHIPVDAACLLVACGFLPSLHSHIKSFRTQPSPDAQPQQ